MVEDHRIWRLGRLLLRRGRGLDSAAWAIFFVLLAFVGAAPCREARSEVAHIENLADAGCIAMTHGFSKIVCATNGGALPSTSIEIGDTIFISAWSSDPAPSRLDAESATWVQAY
jgi:hypothetical protein